MSLFFINPIGIYDPKKPIPFGKSKNPEPTQDREEYEDDYD